MSSGRPAPRLAGQRVLVTGGLGFIGSNVAHRAAELGAHVTLLDNLDPACGGNRTNTDGLAADLVAADVNDATALAQAVAAKDLVVHCAAFTSHGRSLKEPRRTFDSNVAGTCALLEALRAQPKPARLVHVGTTTQVGRMQRTPIDETHPEAPLEPYSASKSAAEKLVLAYSASLGLDARVVRLGNTYGPRACIRSADLGFINFFVGLALQDRELRVFGDGQQLRSMTFVDDAVDALLLAGAMPEARGEVLHAVASGVHSVRSLAEGVVAAAGQGRIVLSPWPQGKQAIEVGDAIISAEKIQHLLGWRARVSLAEGLQRTCTYFRTRLDRYLP